MLPVARRRLGDRYTLTERVAVGGMGEVWKAHDDVLMRTVAIKILPQQFLDSTEFTGRFRAEARHSASLAHPGVARVYDYAEDGEGAYLVMEFVAGEPLSALLARTPVPPLTTTLSILAQTAEALAAAHAAGIVHRDIKPGNVMITPDGVVKVTDFGIARAADALPLTATGQVVGTPQYMSPEQASGGHVGPASDIYSLGVVGYEALAGRRPFVESTPLALAMAHVNSEPPPLSTDLPAGVADLIGRMMAKDQADRPGRAGELAVELRALQMRVTPPPLSVGEAPPATLVDIADAPTRHLAAGSLAVAAPRLVIDERATATTRRRLLVPVGVVAAVGLLLVLLVALARHDAGRTLGAPGSTDPATPTTSTTAPNATSTTALVDAAGAVVETTTTAVTAVVVDPASYLGKPVAEARAALEALGLHVEEKRAPGRHQNGNVVVDVQPVGEVAPGSSVTITVGGKPKGKGKD